MNKPTCFVVMGFGMKTAYSKDKPPRVLDLNATYEAIIQPAVEKAGFQCIRADAILHSGMIDVPMYEMLLQADLVIADISTGNVNAVYELGVRHALRPSTTIIMKEDQGDFSFDLSHISTLAYEHLGSDIGTRIAKQKVEELCALIQATAAAAKTDSPVYICLPQLAPASALTPAASATMLSKAASACDPVADHLERGRQAMKSSKFVEAAEAYGAALGSLERSDSGASGHSTFSFIIQQLALATYKGGKPNKKQALDDALKVLSRLSPATSGDIETMGIAGAIHKRIYENLASAVGTEDPETRAHLDRSIEYYGRGYNLVRDYYNGENFVNCLDARAAHQKDPDEATCDRVTARRVRTAIIRDLKLLAQLNLLEADPDTPESGAFKQAFFQRPDWDWLLASLANCLYATGKDAEAQRYERIIFSAAAKRRGRGADIPAQNDPSQDWDHGTVELEPWTEQGGVPGWKLETYRHSRARAMKAGVA